MEQESVETVKGDMCCFGMYQETERGMQLVKKPTGFMTNASELAKQLSKKCEGGHRHVNLINGRAKRAEVYPDELCHQILIGIMMQMKMDGRIQPGHIGIISAEEEYKQAWDDTTGKELDWEGVKNAR